jgi:hypothetical protein
MTANPPAKFSSHQMSLSRSEIHFRCGTKTRGAAVFWSLAQRKRPYLAAEPFPYLKQSLAN